jgi:F-type H+-transporting ATPase subunit delta
MPCGPRATEACTILTIRKNMSSSHSRIGVRYAKALLGLAIDQNKVEEVKADFLLVRNSLEHKQLASMFKSPVITADKKQAVVDSLYQGKVSDLTLMYIKLLIGKGRESYLREISEEYASMSLRHQEITDIKVISAAPLSDAVLAEIRNRMTQSNSTGKSVQITNEVDESLIGGFILEFDDKRYDASILSQLNNLKGEFSKNLYIKEF